MPKPYNPHDPLMVRAKKEGYRARSVYKLEELDQRFSLFRPGLRVLDLGAFPGSWLQYVSQVIGPTGLALGIDLKPISRIARNVQTMVADIKDLTTLENKLLTKDNFDVVISDLAPNTTGIPGLDQSRSVELSRMVVEIAKQFLHKRGNLVMKVFEGEDFQSFYRGLKPLFREVKAVKVAASRDRSKEIYVVCLKKV